MITYGCFTDPEDSATLGSDTSAVSGLREAVQMYCLFCICLLETKIVHPVINNHFHLFIYGASTAVQLYSIESSFNSVGQITL